MIRRVWYAAALLLFLALACWQLNLPGLHYDEAKEAGLNAMEMLTGAPISAFRGAGLAIGGRVYPLMVQDYIGALNVYLALPFLALTGIGVPNLRLLPVLTALAALILLERAVSEWVTYTQARSQQKRPAAPGLPPAPRPSPLTLSGLLTLTLLAASPSYVFWARQGIFVTNLMLPFVFLCLWMGVRWLRTGRSWTLLLAALAGGLALYAKLLAGWVIGPFVLLVGGWWVVKRVWGEGRGARGESGVHSELPRLSMGLVAGAAAAFLLPLAPFLIFNWQTGGTLAAVGSNLHTSYYGVDNADVLGHLPVRLLQLVQSLRGDQFWYLGGPFANALAPWLAAGAVIAGLWRSWRRVLPPLLLLAAAVAASLFTVSDLFVTHYVLIQPLAAAVAGLALGAWLDPTVPPSAVEPAPTVSRWGRLPAVTIAAVTLLWLVLDLAASVQYHRALASTGGLIDHSDASYHLAYHLRYNGLGAPIALDWGMDAPVRYLSEGTVTPIEIFGYASPAGPDAGFDARLAPFLENPANVYLLRAPSVAVFQGRREAFLATVAQRGYRAIKEQQFTQRDGAPIVELWRVQH